MENVQTNYGVVGHQQWVSWAISKKLKQRMHHDIKEMRFHCAVG